jgi:triosephosphate isomerase (TIM)
MMRKPLIVGNWKMNGSRDGSRQLLEAVKVGVADLRGASVAVCPPYVFLPLAESILSGSAVAWGAQNVSQRADGAFTGEISTGMLLGFGCTYVIVGHSERRTLYGEGDQLVAEKFVAARRAGLTPILCVGEQLSEREAGETEMVVARQLDAVLDLDGVTGLAQAVIAYEPVWAIGTGRTATPEQAQEVHAFIRDRIRQHDAEIAEALLLLYGGSVKASNAAALFAMPDIDGGLIGGASLDANEFLAICRAAA